jgi:hypothetical protein
MAKNEILTRSGWQTRVREKMGVLDSYLPDSAIEQPDVIGIAEANIIAQIPDYATLEDDARVYLESAVVCECCVLLCPSMQARLPIQEQGPASGHRLYVDWEKKQALYAAERDGYVGKILYDSPLSPPSLLHFRVTYPKREWL